MRNARGLDNLALAALVGALVLSMATLAAPHVATAFGDSDARAIPATRTRLERLSAVRGDGGLDGSDERFDALLASLQAGLGSDAPEALRPALDRIAAARSRERATSSSDKPRAAHQHGVVDSEVDRSVADALRTFGEIGRETSPSASALIELDANLPWAIAALVLMSIGGMCAARAARRRQAGAAAGLLGCDLRAAEGADLVASINRHVDLACEAAVARALERAGGHVGAARPTAGVRRPSVAVAAAPAARLEPILDPACAVRARVELEEDTDTGDYDLDTPIPGCDSFRIAEIKALPLDDLPTAANRVED